MSNESAAPSLDGRTARRERGRTAVIEAVVSLLLEGHAPPTTAQVVARSGISEASVFRYFTSLDDLQEQATASLLQRNAHLFSVANPGEGPFPDRVERFTRTMVTLWSTVGPAARLGRARSFDQPVIADQLLAGRLRQADQVANHFSPELSTWTPQARADAVATITALTSFESWDLCLRDLGRTPAQIRRAWRSVITALLTTPTPQGG